MVDSRYLFSHINDRDFEVLIAKLLKMHNFHNVELYDGGGDRGRDVVASKEEEIAPGRSRVVSYRVECKNICSRGVNVQDLQSSVGWFEADQQERMIIYVSSHLTPDTKDWIEKQAQRIKRDIIAYSGSEILDQLAAFPTLRDEYFPPSILKKKAAAEAHEFINSVSDAEIGQVINIVGRRSAPWRAASPFIYLKQHHTMVYAESGMGERLIQFDMFNMNEKPMDYESFSFFGNALHAPLHAMEFNRIVGDHKSQLEWRDLSSSDQVKTLTCHFDEVAPFQFISIEARFKWPFALPVDGPRYYGMSIARPTREAVLTVKTPNGYRRKNERFVEEIGPISNHLVIDDPNADMLSWHYSVRKPKYGSMYRLYFDLEKNYDEQ